MKKIILILLLGWVSPWMCLAQSSLSIHDLVQRVAPQVWLHSNEDYMMSSVDWYLPQVKKQERMETYGEYVNSSYPNTFGTPKTLSTYFADPYVEILTTVNDGNINDAERTDWPGRKNLVLAHKTGNVGYGSQASATCYVHVKESYYQDAPLFSHDIDIMFWYFYPYNGTVLHHDGDWEMVMVKASPDGTIKKIGLSSHGDVKWYNPWELGYTGTHPIVYSAQKSHAFYESPGTYAPVSFTSPDKANQGTAFNSWSNYEIVDIPPSLDHSVSVPNHNWLNYNGLWGKKGASIFGESSSAPTGPKPYTDYWIGKVPNEQIRTFVPNFPYFVPHEPDVKGNQYPASVIAGPADVCSSSNATYTINTAANVEVNWHVSPASLVTYSFDPTKNKLLLKGASGSSQGWVTISATTRTNYNGYTVINSTKSKKVWVGRPDFSTPNTSIQGPRRIVQATFGDFDAPLIDGVKSFQWIVPPGWSVSHASSRSAQIHVGNSGPGNYMIQFRATSDCSSLGIAVSQMVEIYTVGGGGGNPSDYVQGANPAGGKELSEATETPEDDEVISSAFNSEQLSNSLLAYPNPTTGNINVRLPSDLTQSSSLTVKVFDLSAQLVETLNFDNYNTSNFSIDLTNEKKGIYMLKVYDKNVLIGTRKIIKQ